MEKLTALRDSIAVCDKEIAEALKKRMACVEEIMQYKKAYGLPILQPEQEKLQQKMILERTKDSVFQEEIIKIFEEIIENSKKIQAKTLFQKNILLIGFMGAGKSTVSTCLAQMLALEVMEMDAYIQQKEGKSIPEIFAEHGEEYFRNCESNTLIALQERKHMVVSCGGGVPLREQNRALLQKSGTVVWLTATPEEIYERVKDSTERPLLNGNMNVPYIRNLMESRREKYEKVANIKIDTTNKTVLEICEEMIQKLFAMEK